MKCPATIIALLLVQSVAVALARTGETLYPINEGGLRAANHRATTTRRALKGSEYETKRNSLRALNKGMPNKNPDPTTPAPPPNTEIEVSATYKTSDMDKALDICGYKPATGGGPLPLFVYVTGTRMNPCNDDDAKITLEAAKKGFVAISVDYGTRRKYPFSCDTLKTSVRQIFGAESGSAINSIASAIGNVDLTSIVVMGFSQGANIASLSKNNGLGSPNVKAAFLIGNGYENWGSTCYNKGNVDLSSSEIRSAIGQYDSIFQNGGGPDENRAQMETTTGVSCDSALSCIDPGGGGWYLVQGSETASGRDGHCFHYLSGCGGTFDSNFVATGNEWTLPNSLDWLAGKVGV